MLVKMTTSVATQERAFNVGEQYDLDSEMAEEFTRLGWAVAIREATTKTPAKRKATRKRVTKR